MNLAAAIAAAAEAQPHARPDKVAGRTLLVDGDALAYYCAGNDDTSAGMARRNLEDKIESAMRAAGADKATMLVTSSASHKGHRYAIATVKPYQGKRSHSRRPKNWQLLRELIERDQRTVATDTLEADDLFHAYSVRLGDENVAILTQDKDMRMVPGWHLDWQSHRLVRVHPDTWEFEVDGKVYGRKWFWLQMLMGDAADNVPGLPKYIREDGKAMLCGEVTAAKLLAECADESAAAATVRDLYAGFYGPHDYRAAMLEQACLLWMRRTDRLFDCTLPEGPMDFTGACVDAFGDHGVVAWQTAIGAVRSRVVDL